MDEHIYTLAYKLQQLIINSELLKRFSELDNELTNSFDVYMLSQQKDRCIDKYSRLKDALGEDNEETILALKEAQNAKEKLNNFPLVKEYLRVYSQVRDLYLEVDNILLSDYRKGKEQCR